MSNTALVFATLSFDDATTILNQYQTKGNGNETLFEAAEQILDEGEEDIQFELFVSKNMAEWLQTMILDEKDESGIFDHILTTYCEKTNFVRKA